MSKPRPRRRTNQPPIPPVSPATCRALLEAADAFGTLAPWTWMHDSELLGLRQPASGEVSLCSILGRMRTVFALLVYRHDAGHRWVLNTIMNDGDSGGLEDPDSAFEQDCVKVEFTGKRELTQEDRAVIAAAAFTPAVARGCVWPAFRSLVPGGYPWYPTQAEAETLLWALPRVSAFARLCRDTPELVEQHETGEVAFLPLDFDPAQRPLRREDLDWQPMIPPPEPPPVTASLDEAALERLLRLPQAKGFHLELDVFYSYMPVSGAERPRFPKLVMAVDRASGFIGGCGFTRPGDSSVAAQLAEVVTNTLVQLAHRPETICVQRRLVGRMVSPLAKQLGIAVREDPELPALNLAREDLVGRFQR